MNVDNKLKLQIKNIVSEVSRIDVDKIGDSLSLRNDLWIDSLQAIQIMALIDKEFDIKVDEIEIFNVDTINDVLSIVKEYLEEKD